MEELEELEFHEIVTNAMQKDISWEDTIDGLCEIFEDLGYGRVHSWVDVAHAECKCGWTLFECPLRTQTDQKQLLHDIEAELHANFMKLDMDQRQELIQTIQVTLPQMIALRYMFMNLAYNEQVSNIADKWDGND